MSLTIGSLCTGYGGLDGAVTNVLDARTVWVSDIDKGACKVLAHRFPDAPNLGDMTAVDWAAVEPVDVLTGGTPCQDLSHAGKRAGMTEGTRSNLWVTMREAVATLRPRLVIWENVAGAYSAEADSELVRNPRLLASVRRRDGDPVLRALGRVLGDLASLGYVGGWHGLRAADVGAPHGRLRVFVVAVPANAEGDTRGLLDRDGGAAADAKGAGKRDAPCAGGLPPQPGGMGGPLGGGEPEWPICTIGGDVGPLLPTPVADNSRGLPSEGTDYQSLPNAVCALLPTPAVNDMGAAYTPDEWDAWTDRMKAKHGNGNGHGASLAIEAQRLLPTPRVTQAGYADDGRGGKSLDVEARTAQWGQYAAAIARWETLTRPTPAPTETGPKGNPRLSPRFTEWLMGVPDGWICDVPGVTRNEALKLCGNGVVPQQAAEALRVLLPIVARLQQEAAA